jgi:hypothetical protein
MERQRFGFVSFVAVRQFWKVNRRMATTRHTSTTVTFQRPFILDGFEQLQPAGSYTLDMEEELLDALLSPVWKRTSTAMRLTRHGAIEQVPVDPEQLNDALARDAAQPDPAKPLSSSSPEARRYRAYSLLGRLPHRNRR